MRYPDKDKLIVSFLLSLAGVALAFTLYYLMPGRFTAIETALITGVGAWLVNALKETWKANDY